MIELENFKVDIKSRIGKFKINIKIMIDSFLWSIYMDMEFFHILEKLIAQQKVKFKKYIKF